MSDLSAGTDALDHLDERVKRLGSTLTELGWDQALHQLVAEIPDARERLRYVGQMTEDAANKVLNMVDATQPQCHDAAREGGELADRLSQMAGDGALTLDSARAALLDAVAQLRRTQQVAGSVAETLTSIMLAQDFQDLSGQVIKKVVGIITHTEEQLQRLLAQSEGKDVAALQTPTLQGPQVPDKAVSQSDVDDLLASLDF